MMLTLLLWLNVYVSWHYSWGNESDPLCCRIFGRSLWNYDSLCHENLWYEYEIQYARMLDSKCTKNAYEHIIAIWSWLFLWENTYDHVHYVMDMGYYALCNGYEIFVQYMMDMKYMSTLC